MILAVTLAAVFGLAAIAPLLTRMLGRDAGYVLAGGLAVAAAALGLQAPAVLDGRPVEMAASWVPSAGLGFALRMDVLGLLFAMIVLGIGAAVMAYSARYFKAGSNPGRMLGLLAFFAASMLGLVLADDIILLFVFWEFTSVTSFFLIGGKGEGRSGATRAFMTTALGGLALLAGLVLMGVATGEVQLSSILANGETVLASPLAPAIMILVMLGAFTKSAQFPFHFWLPGAMVAPTPVSTYLHAATMVKAGIYLLFRLSPVFAGEPLWQYTLVLGGLFTMLMGAVIALKKTDLKSLLAYSTVSQLGFLTALIGVGHPLALAAAGLHTLAHALFKSTLFMTVGIVDHETGTRDIRKLSGLGRAMPLTAATAALAAISMAGLPPLMGFVSKEEAFAAFLETGGAPWLAPAAATLAVTASIFTFAYSARYFHGTFAGPRVGEVHKPPDSFVVPASATALAGLLLGLAVWTLDPLANGIALDTTGASADVHLGLWHGFELPLLMSAIVVGGGLALFLAREQVEMRQGPIALPADGEDIFDRLYDGTLRLGAWVGSPAASDRPAMFMAPVLATLACLGVVAATYGDLGLPGPAPEALGADWVVVGLLAVSVTGVIMAGNRLAAIALLGLSGFLVAAWFVLLGAPDLAATQLLVETLTVAVVVLVFRRLPRVFTLTAPARRVGAALTAVVVGVLAASATYTLTGRRGLSEPGAYFLENAEAQTGGSNVVNTILVDFRALDTLGEITVLVVAAAGMYALVRAGRVGRRPKPGEREEVG